jgi:cyclase
VTFCTIPPSPTTLSQYVPVRSTPLRSLTRTAFVLLASAALVLPAPPRADAQRNFDDVEIEATGVAGNVYVLEGAGGNIGVSVGGDGILIVDDQFAPLAPKIRAALGELGEGGLAFVLNTHWHGDHVGGNEVFGKEAPIIAHANVRRRLATRQELRGRVYEARPPQALPVVTFQESLSVHFNGEEIRAVHFPHGHTDGDVVVFFTESNVVHMGDDLFEGAFPFVDLESGGSVEGLVENVGRVLGRLPADAMVIPGHGEVTDRSGLAAFHEMLEGTVAVVRGRMEEGRSLEEIQAEGLPGWEEWSSDFIDTDTWIETVFHSLGEDSGE